MTGDWRLVPGEALVVVPWRNGLGTSRTIAGAETPEGGLLWQVGIAELVRDAAFSHYAGIERVFTPIGGGVPALSFHGGPFEPCPLLVPKRFGGDWPTLSRIAVPGRAFNALADRGQFRVDVVVLRLAPDEARTAPGGTVSVLHCLEGAMSVAGHEVRGGDSVVGRGAATASAPGGGVAIAVAFERI